MKYLFYLVCLLLLSCSSHKENGSNKSDSKHELSPSTSSEVIVDEEDNSLGFEDGTYEAEV